MPSLRKMFAGLEVLMNYLPDDEDDFVTVARSRIWVDGTPRDDLAAADLKKLEDSGWTWNYIRGKWFYS